MPRRSPISSSRRCRCCRAPSIRSSSCRPAFRAVSHANPFFYVISGFRYGFLGESRFADLMVGAIGLLVLNIALWAVCYVLLRSGWKIKN